MKDAAFKAAAMKVPAYDRSEDSDHAKTVRKVRMDCASYPDGGQHWPEYMTALGYTVVEAI